MNQPEVRLPRFSERLLEALQEEARDLPPAAPLTAPARRRRSQAMLVVIGVVLVLLGLAAAGRLSVPGVPDDVIARFAPWRQSNGISLKDARLFLRVTLPRKAFVSDQYGELRTWEVWRAPEKVGPPCEQSRMEFAHGQTFASVGCRGSAPVPVKRLEMDSWQNAPGEANIVFAVMWPGARSAVGVFTNGERRAMHVQGRGAWLVVPPHMRLRGLQMLDASGHVLPVDGDLGGFPPTQ
jgi:hypothetical protein